LGGRGLLAATALPWARDGLVRLVDKAFPGLWAGVMCRKRRIDEALSMADGRFGAVLNLGARWDTRAYPRRLGGRSAPNDRRQPGTPARAVRPNARPT
jgi:O-methyltransferase involved in polyketide biosynthesis